MSNLDFKQRQFKTSDKGINKGEIINSNMLKSRFDITEKEESTSSLEGEEYESKSEPSGVEETAKQFEHLEIKLERKLNRSEVSVRLSQLGKTADGDGYAYLKATCTSMGLTDIKAITAFEHLQIVDLTDNLLTTEALQVVAKLPFLVLLHANKNRLNSAALPKTRYLQVVIMNHNNIKTVHDVYQPELSTLEIGYNKLEKIEFKNRMPTLRCLDFRYNLITDISNFDFPNLDSLYLAGNKITSLMGIGNLINLRILHLRNNPIASLNGFDPALTKLQYVNLRNCKVATLKQVKKLQCLKSLEILILKGCPYMGGTGEEGTEITDDEDTEQRIEVLAVLPRLKRLNKGVVTPEERAEAKALMIQLLEEDENDIEETEEVKEEEMNKD